MWNDERNRLTKFLAYPRGSWGTAQRTACGENAKRCPIVFFYTHRSLHCDPLIEHLGQATKCLLDSKTLTSHFCLVNAVLGVDNYIITRWFTFHLYQLSVGLLCYVCQ